MEEHSQHGSLQYGYAKIYCALQKLKLPISRALEELREVFFSKEICTKEVFEKLQNMIYEKKIRHKKQLYEAMEAMVVFEDDTRIYYESGDKNQVHMLGSVPKISSFLIPLPSAYNHMLLYFLQKPTFPRIRFQQEHYSFCPCQRYI